MLVQPVPFTAVIGRMGETFFIQGNTLLDKLHIPYLRFQAKEIAFLVKPMRIKFLQNDTSAKWL